MNGTQREFYSCLVSCKPKPLFHRPDNELDKFSVVCAQVTEVPASYGVLISLL